MNLAEYNVYYNQDPMPPALGIGAVVLQTGDYYEYVNVEGGKIVGVTGYTGRYFVADGTTILQTLNGETGRPKAHSVFRLFQN